MLAALDDDDCRSLLRRLTEGPLTAEELSCACEIPSSTLYRKMDKLIDGGLVAEGTEISTGGRNATLYEQRIDGVSIRIDDPDGIELKANVKPAAADPASVLDLASDAAEEADDAEHGERGADPPAE